jgi:anti-anti-sigma factor
MESEEAPMSLSLRHDATDKRTVISIKGPFTLALRTAFLDAIGSLSSDLREIVVDLTETELLDASALGMLIMLRQKHPATDKVIMLSPDSPIAQHLEVAGLSRLFAIEAAI